jgi:hypothetical protein
MLFQSLLVVLLTVLQCSYSEEVESIVVRLVKPSTSDDYMPGSDGSYEDGDTVSIDALSTSIYYCAVYNSVASGHLVNIIVEGLDSGAVRGPSDKEMAKTYSTYRRYYGTSMNTFAIDSQIKVTAVIKDELGTIISEKSMEFNLEVAPAAEAEIVSFIARFSAPQSTAEYLEGSSDSIDISSLVSFDSLSDSIYFAQKFSNLNAGYSVELVMTGLDSGTVKTYSKDITSLMSSYYFYYGISINSFGSTNYNLKVELTVYNSDNSPVASDSMTISYREVVVNYDCGEMNGVSNPNCVEYDNQSDCEADGCEWYMWAVA